MGTEFRASLKSFDFLGECEIKRELKKKNKDFFVSQYDYSPRATIIHKIFETNSSFHMK